MKDDEACKEERQHEQGKEWCESEHWECAFEEEDSFEQEGENVAASTLNVRRNVCETNKEHTVLEES